MPSSYGQPIILSVITMDLAPAASMNASTSSATPASLRISAPSENQRRRSVASASSAGTLLDAFGCRWRRGAQKARLELLAMSAVVDPFARRGDPFARRNRRGMPDSGHQVAVPARLELPRDFR